VRSITVRATGYLPMHGASHPVTVTISARRDGSSLQAAGSIPVAFSRRGIKGPAGFGFLDGTTADPRHEFWPDDIPYTAVPAQGIIGHRQLTDAYLAQLARARGTRLATFDQAMAKLHSDVAELVPAAIG
jgi:predicted nucleic acid-binding protein